MSESLAAEKGIRFPLQSPFFRPPEVAVIFSPGCRIGEVSCNPLGREDSVGGGWRVFLQVFWYCLL